MKALHELLRALRSQSSPVYRQLELPLSGRQLTRHEELTRIRLQRLRERLATA